MKKHYFIGLLILLVSNFSFGANRYWVAPGAGNWNDIANWSTTSGGAGGASFPTVGDFAYFDVNSIGDCNINIDAGLYLIQRFLEQIYVFLHQAQFKIPQVLLQSLIQQSTSHILAVLLSMLK